MTGPNPTGLCMCGCGQPAPLASKTSARAGWVNGQPVRFVNGHSGRGAKPLPDDPGPNPSGMCQCGCGMVTSLASQSSTQKGWVRGRPVRFVLGHGNHLLRLSQEPHIVDRETDCWVWQRSLNVHGYGRMWRGSRLQLAHRCYYEDRYGRIPTGFVLDHLCRNPACVNPAHLEVTTQTENLRRGRGAKLSLQAAREIRELHASPGGLTPLTIAQMFGVSQDAIYNVLSGKHWIAGSERAAGEQKRETA